MFKQTYTPYDSIITVGDDQNWIKLSVTSKNQDDPKFNLESSNSEYATLIIPYSFLATFYEECLTTNSFHFPELEETTTITRRGMVWEVSQSWEDKTVTTEINHKDMLSLLQHCSRYFKIQKKFAKEI